MLYYFLFDFNRFLMFSTKMPSSWIDNKQE